MMPRLDVTGRPRFESTRRSIGLCIPLLLCVACADDSGPSRPEPTNPPLYGAWVTPVVSDEVDRYLAKAYQSLTGDEYEIAHTALSWAEIATGNTTRNWEPLDRHVRRALPSGIRLSIVLEIFHGGEVEVPEYLEFLGWSWDESTILWEFARFLREFEVRSKGTIAYLWLGEGPDRYVTRYPETRDGVSAFYDVLADSARAIFGETPLGVMVSATTLRETGEEEMVRALRDDLGMLALSIFPEEMQAQFIDPDSAQVWVEEAIRFWSDAPLAVVETGFSSSAELGSSESIQAEFALGIGSWLADRPENLKLFCWSPLHDAGTDLAHRLAVRRYPIDLDAQARFERIVSSDALRWLDGSRKPGREAFFEARP